MPHISRQQIKHSENIAPTVIAVTNLLSSFSVLLFMSYFFSIIVIGSIRNSVQKTVPELKIATVIGTVSE